MHEFMTRGGPVSLDHMRKLHDAADDLTAAPGSPVGGVSGGPACQVHAGAGTGAGGPVRGFLALLTPEQRAAALAYDGPQDFGPDEFRIGNAVHASSPRTHTIATPEVHDPMAAYISFIDDEGDVALHGVCAIYAAAQRAMVAAGPLPLASEEAWAEFDHDFRDRILREASRCLWCDDTYRGGLNIASGEQLDRHAATLGILRPRLMPMEG